MDGDSRKLMTNLKDTISRLRELEKAATSGEWEFTIRRRVHGNLGLLDTWSATGPDVDEQQAKLDSELIIAARNALPQLLDALERRDRVIEVAMEAIGDFMQYSTCSACDANSRHKQESLTKIQKLLAEEETKCILKSEN